MFDLDDTLLDRRRSLENYVRSLWEAAPGRHDSDREQFVSVFFELDGNGRTPKLLLFDSLCQRFDLGATSKELIAHFYRHAWLHPKLVAGATDLIDACQGHGFSIGIVTNGSSKSQRAELERNREPILITQRGLSKAWLVGVESYEQLQRHSELLEGNARGEKAVEDGRTVTHAQAAQRLSRWLR